MIALVLAPAFQAILPIKSYRIPTGSMEPTVHVRILDKTVYIDGQPLDEPYAIFMEPRIEARDPRADNLPEDRIPEGSYLTLSDNRDNAHDGRFWGYVPAELIRGKAIYVYWSQNLARIGRDFRDR